MIVLNRIRKGRRTQTENQRNTHQHNGGEKIKEIILHTQAWPQCIHWRRCTKDVDERKRRTRRKSRQKIRVTRQGVLKGREENHRVSITEMGCSISLVESKAASLEAEAQSKARRTREYMRWANDYCEPRWSQTERAKRKWWTKKKETRRPINQKRKCRGQFSALTSPFILSSFTCLSPTDLPSGVFSCR